MKLHAKQRNALPASTFGIPGKREYPEEDKPHAAAAKSRASHAVKTGAITPSEKAHIDAKANRVLGGSGHKPKGDNKKSSHWSGR